MEDCKGTRKSGGHGGEVLAAGRTYTERKDKVQIAEQENENTKSERNENLEDRNEG